MPVPASCFKAEVVIRLKMSLVDPHQHNCQHDCAQGNVSTVETSQQEEGRAVDAGTQCQSQFMVGLNVLGSLKKQEGDAKYQCCQQPLFNSYTIISPLRAW